MDVEGECLKDQIDENANEMDEQLEEMHSKQLEEMHPSKCDDHARRWRSIRILYLTMFFDSFCKELLINFVFSFLFIGKLCRRIFEI